MADSLQGTLSGDQLLFPDLPPEAMSAVQALLSTNSQPTDAETAAGNARAAAAYAPLLAQLKNESAPTPEPVPQASNLGTFLGLLAGNLAGSVNPNFAEPAMKTFEQQRAEAANIRSENRSEQRKFESDHSDRALVIAQQMTQDALKNASDAGDDRAAAQKALQLARINDSLDTRRQKALKEAQGEQTRQNIVLRNQERVKANVELKRQLMDLTDQSGLTPAGKLRVRAAMNLATAYFNHATQLNPNTGEREIDLGTATKTAQDMVQQAIDRESGGNTTPPAAAAPTPIDPMAGVRARLAAKKKR